VDGSIDDEEVAAIQEMYQQVTGHDLDDASIRREAANISDRSDQDLSEFESHSHGISEKIFALTQEVGGSISAEHGIGLLKQPWLDRTCSEAEIKYMQQIKQVFDPAGILNPGKLLP